MMAIVMDSFVSARKYWRPLVVTFVILLLVSTVFGIQFSAIFQNLIGDSVNLENLVKGYDHTTIMDMLHVNKGALSPTINLGFCLMGLYLIISAFVNGGLIHCVVGKDSSLGAFWEGGVKYFGRVLAIGILGTGIMALAIALVFGIYLVNITRMMESFPTEKYMVWLLCFLILLFGFLILTLFIISSLAKFYVIQQDFSVYKAIKSAIKTTISDQSYYRLTLTYLLCYLTVFFLQYAFGSYLGMTSSWMILLFVIIQQALIYFKIYWRMSYYIGIETQINGGNL